VGVGVGVGEFLLPSSIRKLFFNLGYG